MCSGLAQFLRRVQIDRQQNAIDRTDSGNSGSEASCVKSSSVSMSRVVRTLYLPLPKPRPEADS
jgi:hypothetical protein